MILTIDLSNTFITLACAEEESVRFSCRLAADKTRTSDEYAVILRLLLAEHGVDARTAEGSILSSVVPELTTPLRRALRLLTGRKPMVVGPGVKTGLNIRLDDPSELGSDFVAASVAAQAALPLPIAVVTMDTAMGIGVIDAGGAYIGGVIAPGVMVSTAALTRRASLLHNVIPQAPGRIICRSTEESMRSGIIYGAAAMLDGLLARIDQELGAHASVVATGTWAQIVVPHCQREGIQVDPDLIHRGLWRIWKKNQSPK